MGKRSSVKDVEVSRIKGDTGEQREGRKPRIDGHQGVAQRWGFLGWCDDTHVTRVLCTDVDIVAKPRNRS